MKLKQFLFIGLILLINFAYASVFIVPGGIESNFPMHPRLFSFFFPLIFYTGALPMGIKLEELKKKKLLLSANLKILLMLYGLSYIIRGVFLIYTLKTDGFELKVENIFVYIFGFIALREPIIIIVTIINEIILVIFLLKLWKINIHNKNSKM
jgi:hypothetical protein